MNRKKILLFILCIIFFVIILSGCIFFQPTGRLSGTVLFIHSSDEVQHWLDEPKRSYVEAYVLFPEDLASDIIFGIDQELIEGVVDPIHFEGADFMALVGLTREGILHIPYGTPEALNGTPSDASVWECIDLGITLQPDTWYLMRETADFHNLTFESFSLIGPDINITVDLKEYHVDYPNFIPIDNRSLTYYIYAVRTDSNMQPGSTKVYFDDVKAGIETSSGFRQILSDGFETQQTIPDIPITLPVSPLNDITEYHWYKENEAAKLSVTDRYGYSGQYSCECDVTFEDLKNKPFQFTLFRRSLIN